VVSAAPIRSGAVLSKIDPGTGRTAGSFSPLIQSATSGPLRVNATWVHWLASIFSATPIATVSMRAFAGQPRPGCAGPWRVSE